jgi:hypothetical protein
MSRLVADLLREFDADRMLLLFSSGSGAWSMSSSIMEAQRAPGEGLPSGPHLRPDHAEILALRAASAASGLGAKHMVLKKRIGRGLYAGLVVERLRHHLRISQTRRTRPQPSANQGLLLPRV